MTFFTRLAAVIILTSASANQLFGQVPTNDACSSALEINVNGGPIDVSNANTLVDGPTPSCGGAGMKDVWYYFT